jgi:hypothetical protein
MAALHAGIGYRARRDRLHGHDHGSIPVCSLFGLGSLKFYRFSADR